ncbi:ClpX C4-type zinc finger protein [Rosenbergiella collisarenosi]|uniref:ClpX C4-type zinc finger protein n=1 Tax=Rosenbergiella collisarenosi TaxID=1544695 RepID=UPI001F4D56B6|nr:ClpX C4-type zinc finger protein [Rosenbergiella collisarenosi]
MAKINLDSRLGFAEYKPDPEDICSLCGNNADRDRLVEAKDGIRICEDCIDTLKDIKIERISKRNEAAISEIMAIEEKMPDSYTPYEFVSAIVEDIRAGKVSSLTFKY